MEKLIKNTDAIKVAKYIISGLSSASVNLLLLWLLVDVFDLWYLGASILAVACGIIVNFTLQKYWTFQNNSTSQTGKQLVLYLSVAGLNLILNTVFMFVLVDFLTIHYLTAQIIVILLLSTVNYFFYKRIFQ